MVDGRPSELDAGEGESKKHFGKKQGARQPPESPVVLTVRSSTAQASFRRWLREPSGTGSEQHSSGGDSVSLARVLRSIIIGSRWHCNASRGWCSYVVLRGGVSRGGVLEGISKPRCLIPCRQDHMAETLEVDRNVAVPDFSPYRNDNQRAVRPTTST